jgi:hypothetical protein
VVTVDLFVKFIFELSVFYGSSPTMAQKYLLPFNVDILNWGIETKTILQTSKLPKGIKFYNLFGTSFDSPFHAWIQFSPSFCW